ncbi:MobV family relaxase [Vibrio vulnificus]|uniref:MobV family relaxase n=1 Tax=Vibrio vulnificus TaxID=672 RepID=UPI0040582DE1
MGTTILRFEKIKSMPNIRQSGAHQFRHHSDTPNADPAKKSRNHIFLGSGNLGRDVQERLDKLTTQPRKNAVLAMDGLVTLSPELFNKKGNLNIWANRTKDWLKERFGENLVSAVVHLDESSPHLHFTVVPLDEKPDGRKVLNARDMFDKWQLADMQRSYNQAMKKYIPTVESPKHGSKAKHTTIKQFYSELEGIKKWIRGEAKAIVEQMRLDATETLTRRLMPMMERRLVLIEEKFGQRLEKELRDRMMNDYKRELCLEITNSFETNATLKGIEDRLQVQVDRFDVQKLTNTPKRRFKP